MVLLTQIGVKDGLKFPLQNCVPDQKEKDTHVHREEIYRFGENCFLLRGITACFKSRKKEERKYSSLIMSALTWPCAPLGVRGSASSPG